MPLSLRILSNGLRVFMGLMFVVLLVLFIDARARSKWADFTDLRLEMTDDGEVTGVTFGDVIPSPEDLQFLRASKSVSVLNLRGSRIDDELIDAIAQLPRIRWLLLSDSNITDDQLHRLPNLGTLTRLDLSRTLGLKKGTLAIPIAAGLRELEILGCPWFNDEHLRDLSRFSKLAQLKVESESLTDSGFSELGKLPSLTRLSVANAAGVTDGIWPHVANLKELSIQSTGVSLKGFREFQKAHPDIRLLADYSDFPELRPLIEAGGSTSDRTFEITDNAGLDFSVLQHLATAFQQVRFSGTGVNDQIAPTLAAMTNLVSLDLSGSQITDATVDRLKDLSQLEHLNLSQTRITDAALRTLAQLPALKSIQLAGTSVTDDGLQALSGKALTGKLNLSSTAVTAKSLAALNGVSITALNLSDTGITDDDLKSLANWTSIHWLLLQRTKVTGTGIQHVPLTQYATVDLSECPVTDSTISSLAGVRNLGELILAGTSVTGATLHELKECFLYSLDISRGQLSDAGCSAIRQLPHLMMFSARKTLISEAGFREILASKVDSFGFHSLDPAWKLLRELPLNGRLMWVTLESASPDDLEFLAKVPALNNVTLIETRVDSMSMRSLSAVRKLHRLALQSCELVPEWIADFRFPNPTTGQLVLQNSLCTAEDMKLARRLNPELNIRVVLN